MPEPKRNVRLVPARTSDFSLSERWRAAAVMGLISSTYSTIISHMTAGLLGRDALVDWMVVGSIALREHGLQATPTWWAVLMGLIVHQSADFFWEVVFFFVLSRWSYRLGPWALMGVALPWAIFTSGIEWMFLVPVVPFWWPVFTLEQAWWLGILVHLTAASTYPLFPFVRDWVTGVRPSPHRRFARAWTGLGAAGVLTLGGLSLASQLGHDLPHAGGQEYDRTYMANMSAHYAQGMQLAEMAAERASDPQLGAIARLMVATQRSEIEIFRKWHRSWFGGELPTLAPQDHVAMPGMISGQQLDQLATLSGPAFDARFREIMRTHHSGAITMADEALHMAGDPRLRIMAHGIRHQQQGEINLMHEVSGFEAVRRASRAMFFTDAAVPVQAASADGVPHQH
ncbi:DUF305 domain-containing protein [Devosia submarina]|uniref:DUF305 domain-containing protein n=1 Tax=Devosia submarina TaxID=1173082 RepID=UPI001300B534|nr:DUF305 domain-containing protein [Devosia submarina]